MDLDQTPTKTDPDTDEDVRLLCHFSARERLYNQNPIILQVFTRKWYNFLEPRISGHPNIAPLPGVLGRLPPELRFIIYDLVMPAEHNDITFPGIHFGELFFKFPKIAHVCRDMREYAMRKYRFIWYNISVGESIFGEGFGVFDPAKDSIMIHLESVLSVHLIENGTVQWNNPFKTPKLTGIVSSRDKEYPNEGLKSVDFYIGTECEIWQSQLLEDFHGGPAFHGPRTLV
ncbi:hypothetical protein F4680DRAFT_470829 [Xylaria scruposa]|nr:hypothetical protein F4680DRAFT_470829 [Xylaria scruposa]